MFSFSHFRTTGRAAAHCIGGRHCAGIGKRVIGAMPALGNTRHFCASEPSDGLISPSSGGGSAGSKAPLRSPVGSKDRPVVQLKENLPRQLQLDMGHPWVYDDEISNISELGVHAAGTVVDVVGAEGTPLGPGVLNRQASIVVRRLEGLAAGSEVTQELLRGRLRAAFAKREGLGNSEYCRAVNGEQDGLPGISVDRFGSAAVVTFESVGSSKLEFLVQEELARWIGRLQLLAVHRMVSKKEKWGQEGSEFTTDILRGDTSRVLVSESPCSFEVDVNHGIRGHWNYSLERLRRELVERVVHGGTVLDAWSHVGQLGIRCAKMGATEVVLLEDSLGFAKLCKDNVARNAVDPQCTVLHRGSVLDELRSMATSGIRFSCVSLNVRIRFGRYFKHRRGEFGKWFKPSLKGYEEAVYLGAQVTGRGGYLIVSFLLPISGEHSAVNLVQGGLERASRVGSLVYHMTGLDESCALASCAMEDAWSPVVLCIRLN